MNFLTPCAMYHGTSVHQSNRCNKWCTGSEFCEYTLVCSRSNLWFSLTHWRRREVDGSQVPADCEQTVDGPLQTDGRAGGNGSQFSYSPLSVLPFHLLTPSILTLTLSTLIPPTLLLSHEVVKLLL